MHDGRRRILNPQVPGLESQGRTPFELGVYPSMRWGAPRGNRQASPPPMRSQEPDTPQADEVLKIVAEADKSDPVMAALLAIGALAGARRGELCALRWSDLDRKAAVLTIGRSIFDVPGGGWNEKDTKTHQVRRVGLDEVALHVLEVHRDAEDRAKDAG